MWNSKDPPTDMEEILNDTITAQELEVSEISQFFRNLSHQNRYLFYDWDRLSGL